MEFYSPGGPSSSILWIYRTCEDSQPEQEVADSDALWAQFLDGPKVIEPEGDTPEARKRDGDAKKRAYSRAVSGAQYRPGATRRTKNEVVATTALVLDVDDFRPGRPPFTADEIRAFFDGYRIIAWTSYSSTDGSRRWRVVIPLATPCPPSKHVPLFRKIVSDVLEGTVPDDQRHPGRLGFFGTVASGDPADYQWFTTHGEYLDWRAFNLPDEAIQAIDDSRPPDLTPKPNWTSRDTALKAARRRFASTGRGVGSGDRHHVLFTTACQLLWDWAGDEAFATEILKSVDSSFQDPKGDAAIAYEIGRAYDRVVGDNRVAQHVPYGVEREPEHTISHTALEEHIRVLKQSRKEKSRVVARALDRMAAGEIFADDPVEAEAVCNQCMDELARVFAHDPPDRIIATVAIALSAQRARSQAHTVPADAVLAARIHAVQGSVRKREEQAAEDRDNAQKLSIKMAFNSQRDYPYTDAEIAQWEKAYGFNPKRWVIQYATSYFFWVAGEYVGPYEQSSAKAAMPILLSPAEDRVALATRSKDGVKRKSLEEVVIENGQVVLGVNKSMSLDHSDVSSGILRVPACMIRTDLTPHHDPRVEAWLRHLANGKFDLLCSWLAKVPQLDTALAALHLVSPKASGKNLLASGIARLWRKDGSPSLLGRLVMDREFLDDCPFAFCDERLPSQWQREFSARLRAFLSEDTHVVNRKHVAVYSVSGYARLLFASNTTEMLVSAYSMHQSESDALQARILMIRTPTTAAADFLDTLGRAVIENEFVDGDGIARHILWLRDNWVDASPATRFGVVDASNEFTQASQVLNEGESRLLAWVYTFVTGQGAAFSSPAVVCVNGKLWIHSTSIFMSWALFSQDRNVTQRQLGMATAGLSTNKRQPFLSNGRQLNYREVDLDKMAEWLDASGGDVDDFAAGLHRLEAWCADRVKVRT